MHSLPLFHRIAGQTVIVLGDGAAAEAKRRLVARAGAAAADEHDPAARLAFVAIDDPAAAVAAAERLRARGVLVNVVDRPDACDFTTPSLLERDPVLIAIGTGGASAGLAKALRLRLEGLLPEAVGDLARALERSRARLRRAWPDPTARRRALDAAMRPGGPIDPLRGDAASGVASWLEGIPGEGAAASLPSGTVEITVRSDDPDDLTLREARLLGAADAIRHAAGFPQAILARARADAVRLALDGPGPEDGLVVVLLRSPQGSGTAGAPV